MIALRAGSTPRGRVWLFSVVVIACLNCVRAQDNPGTHLNDYVGTYADAPGHMIEIVASEGLFAVVDQTKYRLRSSGVDQFRTMNGQTVSFPRDTKGIVTGYRENGGFHPRVSPTITSESAALARPRPKGEDSPADYRYRTPSDLHDGILSG